MTALHFEFLFLVISGGIILIRRDWGLKENLSEHLCKSQIIVVSSVTL